MSTEKLKPPYFKDLGDALDYAENKSQEEGIVQHVEIKGKEGNQYYYVNDWYGPNTVASFESGIRIF